MRAFIDRWRSEIEWGETVGISWPRLALIGLAVWAVVVSGAVLYVFAFTFTPLNYLAAAWAILIALPAALVWWTVVQVFRVSVWVFVPETPAGAVYRTKHPRRHWFAAPSTFWMPVNGRDTIWLYATEAPKSSDSLIPVGDDPFNDLAATSFLEAAGEPSALLYERCNPWEIRADRALNQAGLTGKQAISYAAMVFLGFGFLLFAVVMAG